MKAYLPQKGIEAAEIDAQAFSAVEPNAARVFFVDGGNATLIETPSFALHLIRVAAVCFDGEQRERLEKRESFCTSTIEMIDARPHIKSTFEQDWGFETVIDAFDKHLSEGGRRVQLSKAGGMMRRFAELSLAAEIAANEQNVVIVLDGTLEATLTGEEVFLQRLYDAAEKNGNKVAGLAKTNSLLTADGLGLSEETEKMAPQEAWQVLVAKSSSEKLKADIHLVKLHREAKHAFRMDGTVAAALMATAQDLTFPGYPYGLILADTLARVPEHEALQLQAKERILRNVNESAQNAHEILDSL